MFRTASTLALLITLAAAALPAAARTAGTTGCEQFLARACSAAERTAFDRAQAQRRARDEPRRAVPFASCEAALGRACTAPETAGFRAGTRAAPAGRAGAPTRCADMLGRKCSAQEERGFARGAGHRVTLAAI